MLVVLIVAAIACIIDQITKIIVTSNMKITESHTIIKGFASFTYVKNDGIAWGMDAKLWILIIVTIIAIGIFLFLSRNLKWKSNKFYILTLGFMLGGTLGNFIDRIFRADHSVIDFLDFIIYYPSFSGGFHFEPYDFPIFNIADSFLVVGAIMFLVLILILEPIKNKKEALKNKDNSEEEDVEVVKDNE